MMSMSSEVFQEIWVSSNYETVFCTEEEKEQYMGLLSSKRVIPRGMSVVLVNRKLAKPHTREEIMNASPDELRQMVK
jgi:UDP-N-acetyl-D-mannosaminuronic acid transferase (WecB/TagA/CpsF family)